MNDTLETANQAVLAVVPARAPAKRPERARPAQQLEPNYHVVIWNDNEHTVEYVIEMLLRLFKMPLPKAYDVTWRIDQEGRGIACTCHRELAELRREQIIGYGPDLTIADAQRVSMTATLEPAEE